MSTYVHPIQPTPPDFHSCDAVWGTGVQLSDCLKAAATLPVGDQELPYRVGGPPGDFVLPLSVSHGRCHIIVEAAGPAVTLFAYATPPTVSIAPSSIRGMAGWVIQQCVGRGLQIGGFVTSGLDGLVDYVNNMQVHSGPHFPLETSFITLTISRTFLPNPSPGNNDPSIPLMIGALEQHQAAQEEGGSALQSAHQEASALWTLTGMAMRRRGQRPWFSQQSVPAAPGEMSYDCNSNLGSPVPADCTHIVLSQPDGTSSSDTLTLAPGAVHFFHSNACYLAISASIALTLTWEQIRTAMTALMTVCINRPFLPAQGGRAYYAPPPQAAALSSRGSRSRRRDHGDHQPTALNALPPHANITIFQQTEPWTDSLREMSTCAWKAVVGGSSVAQCAKL